MKRTPGMGAKALAEQAVRAPRIAGGFRTITTHQLVMGWWLYREGHISRRQLRVYFAAHEMATRREGARRKRLQAHYSLRELAALVGGRGSASAFADLRSDVRLLSKLGLVVISKRAISFAVSIEQIQIDSLASFWAMLKQVPNCRRRVPVPRRMLRALAAGFGRGTTAYAIAMLLRAVYWHRDSATYRLDGRTKGSWISEIFGVSRRAVTDARSHLVQLGWIKPVVAEQWELNRWGAHDAIDPTWGAHPTKGGGFAMPSAEIGGESASPCTNSSPSPSENTRTRIPNESGFSIDLSPELKRFAVPNIRDVHPENLASTDDLFVLYRQAAAAGLIDRSEASELTFFAFAERARAHGTRPAALFTWLLRTKRTVFITQADEEAATERLRAYRNAMWRAAAPPAAVVEDSPLSDDERFYLLCNQIARQQGIADAFRVAFVGKHWTRQQWDTVKKQHDARQYDRARMLARQ